MGLGTTNASQTTNLHMRRPGTGQADCSDVRLHADMTRDSRWGLPTAAPRSCCSSTGSSWPVRGLNLSSSHQDDDTITGLQGDNGPQWVVVNLKPGAHKTDPAVTPRWCVRRCSPICAPRSVCLTSMHPEGTNAFTTEPGSTEQVQIVQVSRIRMHSVCVTRLQHGAQENWPRPSLPGNTRRNTFAGNGRSAADDRSLADCFRYWVALA